MNVMGCICLERSCKNHHPFLRAWVCSCENLDCEEPIHFVIEHPEKTTKIISNEPKPEEEHTEESYVD